MVTNAGGKTAEVPPPMISLFCGGQEDRGTAAGVSAECKPVGDCFSGALQLVVDGRARLAGSGRIQHIVYCPLPPPSPLSRLLLHVRSL